MSNPLEGSFLSHWGLRTDPFSLSPDPEFLFLTRLHAEALAALEIGIVGRRGLIVLVGEVGTGKTTILRSILQRLDPTTHAAFISSAGFEITDLLAETLRQLGDTPKSTRKADLLLQLTDVLHGIADRGEIAALIIDEAQNLDDEALEEFRLLLNVETPKQKLLQIVLSGQPELAQKLGSERLRHLADRIAIRSRLEPLESDEAIEYIEHRLVAAGGSPTLFDDRALEAAARLSNGIPRAINVICGNALLFAFGRGANRVEASDVKEAARQRAVGSRRRRPSFVWLGAALLVALAAIAVGLLSPALRNAAPQGSPASAAATTPESAPTSEPIPPTPSPGSADDVAPVAEGTAATAEVAADESEGGAGEPVPVPTGGATAETSTESWQWLEIEAGDTLGDLIIRLDGEFSEERLQQVLAANPEVDPLMLMPGQRIRFPSSPTAGGEFDSP